MSRPRRGGGSASTETALRGPWDFTAYFHSSSKITDPTYGITSHHTRERIDSQKNLISAYPMTQALRWNPNVETTPLDTAHLEPEHNRYKCKCSNCTFERCPSRSLVSARESNGNSRRNIPQPLENYTPRAITLRPGSESSRLPLETKSGYRDNIMRFNDQWTMTIQVADTGVGCTPVPSKHSEVSAATSDIAVKETRGRMRIHSHQIPLKCCLPILKKRRLKSAKICSRESSNYILNNSELEQSRRSGQCYVSHSPHRSEHPVEVSDDLEFESSQENQSDKRFFKSRRRTRNRRCTRKILYNEGISDVIAQQYPVTPIHDPHIPVGVDNSKCCVKSKSRLDDDRSLVPYSHRTESKYHTNCKHSRSKHFMLEDEARHLQSREAVMKSMMCRTKCHDHSHRPAPIRLPKRLLTSDRDIDAYVDASYPKLYMPPRCVRN